MRDRQGAGCDAPGTVTTAGARAPEPTELSRPQHSTLYMHAVDDPHAASWLTPPAERGVVFRLRQRHGKSGAAQTRE
jgi:hypothetical protein